MYLYNHKDFNDLINQVAHKKTISPSIIEKDYWVTLSLFILAQSEFKDEFIFKGGTSLSKAFNLINRFSEDVDLLFIDIGKNKRKRLEKVRDLMISEGFNYDKNNIENRSGNESRTSCFEYEKMNNASLGSLLPYIKLEMGYRGGQTPNSIQPITSYLAQELLQAGETENFLDLKPFNIKVLSPERTFVEKLFALHAAYENNEIEKRVRHYYDVYCLLNLNSVKEFIGTIEYSELKSDVYKFSEDNFKDSPLPDINSLPSCGFLNPTDEALDKIKIAHESSDLIFSERPSINEIFRRLNSIKSNL